MVSSVGSTGKDFGFVADGMGNPFN